MKRIGTITFHWATNYGAVIQAYALQRFLIQQGLQTEIIDYRPARVIMIKHIMALLHRDRAQREKEKNIARFRNKELICSARKYPTNSSLFRCRDEYDAVICGSDQIWNESFTMGAEGKATLSYFLNFCADKTKRLAYAASFGTQQVCPQYIDLVGNEIKKFAAIGVRENSGREIVDRLGSTAEVVADPALLLEQADYDRLLEGKAFEKTDVFSYLLHNDRTTADRVAAYVAKHFGSEISVGEDTFGVYEWLYRIKHAKFVVTNSFHGTVFSLIFHTPFVVVSVPGSGMNDRLHTLLGRLGLMDRMIDTFDEEQVRGLCEKPVDWNAVDRELLAMRSRSGQFLLDNLMEDAI